MKGLSKTIVFLVLSVILFIIILGINFPLVHRVLGFIQEQFKTTSLSSVEKAILCSYYRCTEGCGSDEADKYCSAFWEDACSKPQLLGFSDNELRVCDWNALQFPVKVSITENEKVYKENLKDVAHCILTEKSDTWDWEGWKTPHTRDNLLFIPERLLLNKQIEDECKVGSGTDVGIKLTIKNTLKEADVEKNDLYISTDKKNIWWYGDVFFTAINDTVSYIRLEKDGEVSGVFEKKPYRINIPQADKDYKFEITKITVYYGVSSIEVNVSDDKHFEIKEIEKDGEGSFTVIGGTLTVKFNQLVDGDKAKLVLKYS
jgi:hypothetical protein